MKKNIYIKPSMEVVKVAYDGCILSASNDFVYDPSKDTTENLAKPVRSGGRMKLRVDSIPDLSMEDEIEEETEYLW